jgi:uncharacterized glyoxalase superfamily protein PhnB
VETVTGLSVNLFVADSEAALRYYQNAFGAQCTEEHFSGRARGEKSAHFTIGAFHFAMADENPARGSKSPLALGGVSACIQLYVRDLDAAVNRALTAGGTVSAPCTVERPIMEIPDGTRFCNITDPFGHVWSLSARV